MIDKFTDGARKAMVYAQEEARALGRQYIGTEHLLLGLIREEEGIAAQALRKLEVTYDEVLETVKSISADPDEPSPAGHIPYTPRVKRVLEGAVREKIAMGQNYIATEHLLLGIMREGNGVAMEALSRMGVTPDAVRQAISDLTPKRVTPPMAGVGTMGAGVPPQFAFGGCGAESQGGSALAAYGRDLTQLAIDGKLDPMIGRESQVERVMEILARRTKNNPLILGEPGVGKTAVVEGLAQKIAAGEVPAMLSDRHVWTLDVSALVAGAKYRGEFEDRLKRVVQEVIEDPTLILFIDEMHTLIGAGSAEGTLDAAAILKPALSRGEIQVIGATTNDEYRKHVEKDPAFARRFQTVNVDEPTPFQTLLILEGLREHYEQFHHVTYTDEAIHAAVDLSNRYIQDRFLPDKAIDLMDEAAATVRIHSKVANPALEEATSELKGVEAELDAAVAAQNYEAAAALRDRAKDLTENVERLTREWEEQGQPVGEVTAEDIAAVVSRATGVPAESLTEEQSAKLMRMEEVLHQRIVGQDEAVTKVAKAIRRSRAGLRDPRRPSGSFIFLGPTGTGKTELCKALAEFLFGTQDALISFDMSEYMEKHNASKLVGAPPGYVGYDEGGELTKAVRQRPYSVVLFDEIEKAHPDIFNVLLQIMEEGRLTDGQGRRVDFSNTVIIMTSNVGAREISQKQNLGFQAAKADGAMDDESIRKNVMGEVKKLFKPEFLNRVDDIVVFRSLTRKQLHSILDLQVEELRRRMAGVGLDLSLTEAAKDVVTKEGNDVAYGARPLRRALQTLVEDPLSESIIMGEFKPGSIIRIDADDQGKLSFTPEVGEVAPLRIRESMVDEHQVRRAPRALHSAGHGTPVASGGASE